MDLDHLISPQRKGWTATVGFDEATGEATDISVNEGYMANSPFADQNFQPDEIQLTTEEAGPGEESHGDQLIIDGLIELYPNIDDILDYAVESYGEDYMSDYDRAVDAGDWDTVQETLARLAAEMPEASEPSVSHEEINKELDELSDMQPEGLEAAYQFLQMADSSSDPIEQDILMSTAAFHRGEVSAQDAIQSMLNKYPIEQLVPIYTKLNL